MRPVGWLWSRADVRANGYCFAMTSARRGHDEDSIYFDRANGYWVAAVSLGY